MTHLTVERTVAIHSLSNCNSQHYLRGFYLFLIQRNEHRDWSFGNLHIAHVIVLYAGILKRDLMVQNTYAAMADSYFNICAGGSDCSASALHLSKEIDSKWIWTPADTVTPSSSSHWPFVQDCLIQSTNHLILIQKWFPYSAVLL